MISPKCALGLVMHYWQTTVHKGWVAYYLFRYSLSHPGVHGPMSFLEAARRAVVHDLSKYRWDEARAFAEVIWDLRTTTYGSEQYKALLRQIGPALELHYARNAHHPNHYESYAAMPQADRDEMLCDWAAAVKRHADGDLRRSIVQNIERFGYDGLEALRLGHLAHAIGAL